MDKTSFELKANYNSFETGGDEGKLIRLEPDAVYTTSSANEIAALRASDAVKEVDVPDGARAGSKTADEKKAAK